MLTPPSLQKGDKIAIVCPAKKITGNIEPAIKLLESWGLTVILGKTVFSSYYQFAGDDEQRTKDFQDFLNDPSIKAIIAARGGYGSVRIIDKLNFNLFLQHPKWIVGFSDITVFHAHIERNFKLSTIHGQMPLTMSESQPLGLQTLRKALFGESLTYQFPIHPLNRNGNCVGKVIGGNLSILVNLLGSVSDMDYTDKILFIEDVGEQLYALDRLLWTLKRANKLTSLKGLVVGSFTALKDDDKEPFGKSVEEIIFEKVQEYNYPVYFNFPAGHQTNNQSIILGKKLNLNSENEQIIAYYN